MPARFFVTASYLLSLLSLLSAEHLKIGIFLTQVVVHIVGNPLFQACKGQGAAHLLHPAHVGLRKILVFSPDNVRYFSHIEKIEVARQVG